MYKLFFFFILFSSQLLFSQTPFYRHYGVNEGLPSSEVFQVIQDKKGFMWFATNNGIARFDGNKFSLFNTNNGLPDDVILGLYEDSNNRIWFRTLSGEIGYYKNDSIHSLKVNSRLKELLKGTYVTSMFVRSDTLFLGTNTDKGVLAIDLKDKNPKIQSIFKNERGCYIFANFNGELVYGKDQLWESQFIKKDDGHPSQTIKLKDLQGVNLYNEKFIGQSYTQTCAIGLKDGSYIFSTNDYVLCFNKNKRTKKFFSKRVYCFFQDKLNGVWVGSGLYGIKYYPFGIRDEKIFEHYLPDLSVSSVCEDLEGGIWICTLEDGVYYLPSKTILNYNSRNGLLGNKVSLATNIGKNLIFRLGNGEIMAIDESNSVPQKLPNVEKFNYSVVSLKNNELLVFGYNGSVILKKFSKTFITKKKFSISFFKGFAGKKFIIWGITNKGISSFDINSGNILNTIKLESRCDALCEDKNGIVWLACKNGLWKYDGKDLEYLGRENPALKNRITDILIDSMNRVWMATKSNGVNVLQNGMVHSITKNNGLTSNNCTSLFIESNNVWVGTNRGISKIILNGKGSLQYSIKNYDKKNGLLINEVNDIAKFNNDIWIASNDGLTFFDPKKISANTIPPPIYVEELKVNGGKRIFNKKLDLSYRENYITIDYIGLSFVNPEEIQYKYKMSGVDNTWKYTSNRTVQYPTLPPGDYKFEVFSISSTGTLSSHPARIFFQISPPFWKRTWFYMMCIAGAIGLLFLFYKIRIKQIRKNLEMKHMMLKNELKALRAQMNPHFIFNSLNSIQRFILDNDVESSQRFLSKFAKLIRYVVEHSEFTLISLEEEINALELYMQLEVQRFKNKFTYEIEIEKGISKTIKIPSMLIQPYVENAIIHGFSHKEETGKISILFSIQESHLKCIILDNGIGRKKAMENKTSLAKGHKSLGMSITKERLEILNYRKKQTSIEIIDLYDEMGTATGTKVEILIPLNL